MTHEKEVLPPSDAEPERYPLEPRYHPIHAFPRLVYGFLASTKLALLLLIAILFCCLAGVTLYRGEQAWRMIFSTLWFNALLVLLVLNIACCFFGRIWGRKLTLVSAGMILFHASFIGVLAGAVTNSLFHFDGVLRLTEGESLPNSAPESYDSAYYGRFFNFSMLKGETSLIKVHWDYKVKGKHDIVAYELAVRDGAAERRDVVYITKSMTCNGVGYFAEKQGFSPLIVMSDRQRKELYGAYIPLQGLRQKDRSVLYTTGTKHGPGVMPFPQEPEPDRLFDLQITLRPNPDARVRGGEATFSVWPLNRGGDGFTAPQAQGTVKLGEYFDEGHYLLSFKELRYWALMRVRYSPGQPLVLWSLWIGLAGMIMTTIGRVMRTRQAKQRELQ
ncbi:cytochrome c biogenesis protein ResB [Geomonas paludis]|uniref:Cytochrome c biogenesis protein ResB n=1 Tax=Geomonas paludis TaxID=2740185 RepID=A0ABY4LFT7_9BACT|nr:cytochrome c biogenesis protein ResB [Geomonas paludis]UPU36732.1 cytochrome c biogenesis protein ResB [Geomonas paludis]